MDVKSAFLNGELAKEVYVQQPPGYVEGKHEHMMHKLHKALCGLRQAPREWNSKLDSLLALLGFKRSPQEHAVYKRTKGSTLLLAIVYVADLIITGSSIAGIAELKAQMQNLFSMSDLSLLSYYLGIEVKQDVGAITLCQSSYTGKILELSGMVD